MLPPADPAHRRLRTAALLVVAVAPLVLPACSNGGDDAAPTTAASADDGAACRAFEAGLEPALPLMESLATGTAGVTDMAQVVQAYGAAALAALQEEPGPALASLLSDGVDQLKLAGNSVDAAFVDQTVGMQQALTDVNAATSSVGGSVDAHCEAAGNPIEVPGTS